MFDGVGHGRRAALGDAEKDEPIHSGGVHDGLEVGHEGLERELAHAPVREPVAALVVADEPMVAAELGEPMAPDRALPVAFEMVQPVGRLDDRWTFSDGRPGDSNAVAGGTEADFLFHGAPGCREGSDALYPERQSGTG